MQELSRTGFGAALTLLILLFSRSAPAHGFSFSVETTRDKQIRIGAFFEGGNGMTNADVTVKDRDGKVVFKGKTDEKGFAFFHPPGPDFYTFVIDDGTGHCMRNRFVLQDFQLDGKVRDLFSAGGLPLTWYEKLRNLPRWLTALFGLCFITSIFGVIGWIRAGAEVRRLNKEIEQYRNKP